MQDIDQLKPYQRRVVMERNQLDTKIGDLIAFLASVQFAMLPGPDKDLMRQQADVMAEYSRILSDRIARF